MPVWFRRWRDPETVRLRANTLLHARETCRLCFRHAALTGSTLVDRDPGIGIPTSRGKGQLTFIRRNYGWEANACLRRTLKADVSRTN